MLGRSLAWAVVANPATAGVEFVRPAARGVRRQGRHGDDLAGAARAHGRWPPLPPPAATASRFVQEGGHRLDALPDALAVRLVQTPADRDQSGLTSVGAVGRLVG